MQISPGTRLGQYEIVSAIGAGGMGQVFKARDTRLGRSVAIKILPPDVANDALRKKRFEREANVISQLNHPHICTVHDFGESNGTAFLVMELVEGESLADRLRRGSLPLADVVRYGAQVAEALDRAHRAGVVHRDLKPANVMLTKTGAKLLDFGLARATEPATTPDDVTAVLSGEGVVVGTLPYMSPEQLQGGEVDRRSDIFALGAVLYEMVTGRRAFSDANSASLIASILEHDPPKPSSLQSVTPAALEHVIVTCLQKDSDARFQSALDVAHQLRWIGSSTSQHGAPAEPGRRRTPRPAWLYALVATLAVSAAIAATAAYRAGRKAAAPPAMKFAQLTFDAGEESHPTVSPDGKMFAFAKIAGRRRDIFLQRVDGRSAINLTNTPDIDDTEPAFSPDGNLIAFRSSRDGGGVFVMGATGESLRRLTDKGFNPSWSPDGKQILISAEQMLHAAVVYNIRHAYVVDVATGATRLFYSDYDVMQPVWSPNGHRVAFWTAERGQRDIYTIASSGDPATLVAATNDVPLDWNPIWSPDGKYLYFSSDRGGTMNLWRIRIDEANGKTRGAPEPIRTPSPDAGLLSITRDGRRIVYQSKTHNGVLRRLMFDSATERLTHEPAPLLSGSMLVRYTAVSPDRNSIAFTAMAAHEDVYIMAADGNGIRQLTNDAARDRALAWWPDGSRIVFSSNRDGEYNGWTIRPDGSGLTRITDMKEGGNPVKVSPDGSWIAFGAANRPGGRIASLTGTLPIRSAESIPDTPRGGFVPRSWSPSGRWITGGASGLASLYVYAPATKQMLAVPVQARAGVFIDDRRILFIDDRDRIGVAEIPFIKVRYIGSLPSPLYEQNWGSIEITPHSILLFDARAEGDIWVVDI